MKKGNTQQSNQKCYRAQISEDEQTFNFQLCSSILFCFQSVWNHPDKPGHRQIEKKEEKDG